LRLFFIFLSPTKSMSISLEGDTTVLLSSAMEIEFKKQKKRNINNFLIDTVIFFCRKNNYQAINATLLKIIII